MSKVPAGWGNYSVGELFDVQLGKMLNQPAKQKQPQYRYLGNSNVKWGRFEFSNLNTMHFSEKEIEKFTLNEGDILMCEGGEVGRCAIWRGNDEVIFYQKALHRLRSKGKINPEFFQNIMQNIAGTKHLDDFSTRTSIAHLTREKLLKLKVNVPPLPEQTKIAQILSTWDKAIATTEKLIGNSQQQKKALMQSLLTGKRRLPGFEGEWKMTSLKNIVSVTYGKSPKDIIQEDGMYPVIGTGGVTGWTDKYLSSDKSVILGRKGTIDRPVLIGTPFWAIDTTFYCQSFNGTDITWFYYFVSNINLRIYNEASGVPSISRENLYAIQFKLPPLPEQQKIAAVLTAADNEIELLQKKLAFLKQEKAALMQQLLTGKRRVKINATEECMDA